MENRNNPFFQNNQYTNKYDDYNDDNINQQDDYGNENLTSRRNYDNSVREEKGEPENNFKDTFISRPMETIKETTSNAIESVRSFSATRVGITVLTLIVGLAILVIVGLIIYWLIRNNLINRRTYLLQESKIPIIGTAVQQLDGTSIPNSGNGKRQTISFWIYIYNPEYSPGAIKHVLHRGQKSDGPLTSGPYIYLDETANKLHVIYTTVNQADILKNGNDDYNDIVQTGGSSSKTFLSNNGKLALAEAVHGVTVDYIPVQRWVHVAIVTNESVNGGSFTVYVDGELVKTKNINTQNNPIKLDGTIMPQPGASSTFTPRPDPIVPRLNISSVDLDHKGDVFVGGSTSDEIGIGFSGMVSKIRFSNYDLNAQDVYSEYLNGPIDSLLAKMGLAAYGVRSPIYKIQ